MTNVTKPCPQCPWRTSNHGKRTPGGFYTKRNLTRLWGGCRRGASHSCHLTDPSHPDHIAAGAPERATAKECPGIVILMLRELRAMSDGDNNITPESVSEYDRWRRKGMTREGQIYWLVNRYMHGGVPLIGGRKLPVVNVEDPEVDLPEHLKESRP